MLGLGEGRHCLGNEGYSSGSHNAPLRGECTQDTQHQRKKAWRNWVVFSLQSHIKLYRKPQLHQLYGPINCLLSLGYLNWIFCYWKGYVCYTGMYVWNLPENSAIFSVHPWRGGSVQSTCLKRSYKGKTLRRGQNSRYPLIYVRQKVKVKVAQSCPTFCDPMVIVHGLL